MNETLENDGNNERSCVLELLRKPFKQRLRYEEATKQALEELSYSKDKELARRNVFPLLKVLPIRLIKSDNKRSDMFHSLRQYCKTNKHKSYGEEWPTELADSMGLDSLLDWDFDTDAHEDTNGSTRANYKPTETLIITERTVAVQGYQHIFTTNCRIIDAIVIPNQNQTNKNDTCLICLSTGEIISLDFCYSWESAIYNIECVCTGGNPNPSSVKLEARFIYSSEDDTVMLVTSLLVMCVVALHKRERTFFKPEFNVLLQIGCDVSSSTWQAGKLLYMVKRASEAMDCVLIEQDVLRFGPFEEILTISDVHDSDKLVILERDNVLQINAVSKMGSIISGGLQRTFVGALDVKFSKEVDVHIHDLGRVFNEPLKKAHLLVLENSVVVLCMATDTTNKIISFVVTRLPIPIDDITIEQLDTNDLATFLVVSRAEVYRYTIDFHEAIAKEMTSENDSVLADEMPLANVTNVFKMTEGYEDIEDIFRFKDMVLLRSKNKTYHLPRAPNRPVVHMDQLAFFTEFQAFHEVKVYNLKQQEDGVSSVQENKFGPIPIRHEDPQVEQYILVGLSFFCSAEAYYVEVVNNEQVEFQIIDDLLPETQERMIEFGIIDGKFISVTETAVYVNDFEGVKSHTLPFSVTGARVTKECGILVWPEGQGQGEGQEQEQEQANVYSIDWETGNATATATNAETLTQNPDQYDTIDAIKLDATAAPLDWAKSTVTGKILLGSTNTGTVREIDTDGPMRLAKLTGPWIVFYNATSVNVLNVLLEGCQACCMDHPDSIIVEVTCPQTSSSASSSASSSSTHVFTLHDNGLAVNSIRVNEPHGRPSLEQDWAGMEWTIEMGSDLRIVSNSDMSKLIYIQDGDSGALQVENRPKHKLPGEIVGYAILDDEARRLCVLSFGENALWADVFTRGIDKKKKAAAETLQWESRTKALALEGGTNLCWSPGPGPGPGPGRIRGRSRRLPGRTAGQFVTVVSENGAAEVLQLSLRPDSASEENKLAADKRLSIPMVEEREGGNSCQFFDSGGYVVRVTHNATGSSTSTSSITTPSAAGPGGSPDSGQDSSQDSSQDISQDISPSGSVVVTVYSAVPCGTTMRIEKKSGDFRYSDSF
ncbi:glycoside hydrolase [Kluyveromyces marxianus]|uniref:Glycoside hydrolase n=1 Tax=Kluyveromyces marxianus (strain DMKU3-1042 / BCC 29191 / NBRC 104275) TaxID=1003335 RepID=W0T5S4_KLUMD|nr:glycoside hydrolase [Kluyveromyces marxianus DMKU3-1042]BAO38166.1 glycoside hydrolase [Kluyveromyces marxianus DMKU3-1042]BAP69734.1 glycoside hydrolase [Kluyveromyces marxianus]